MSPRGLTPNQVRQLLALLEAGARGRANAVPESLMSWSSSSVLAILFQDPDQLVGYVAPVSPPARLRPLAGTTLPQFYLTAAGEAEARRLVRELTHG
jgi:hypothetical protein